MNNLKKVVLWRIISVIITFIITWAWTHDVRVTTSLTIVLHVALLLAHWIFEDRWTRWTVDRILAPPKKRPGGRR